MKNKILYCILLLSVMLLCSNIYGFDNHSGEPLKKTKIYLYDQYGKTKFNGENIMINIGASSIVFHTFERVLGKEKVIFVKDDDKSDVAIIPNWILFSNNESKLPGPYNMGIDANVNGRHVVIICNLAVDKEKPTKDDFVAAGLTCAIHILADEIKKILEVYDFYNSSKIKDTVVSAITYSSEDQYKIKNDFFFTDHKKLLKM